MNAKRLFLEGILISTLTLGGCFKNTSKEHTNNINNNHERYIIVKENGGKITDVYKLDNAKSVSIYTTGAYFIDQDLNRINILGDTKIIREAAYNNTELWNKYVEYHMEFEKKSYQEVRDSLLRK